MSQSNRSPEWYAKRDEWRRNLFAKVDSGKGTVLCIPNPKYAAVLEEGTAWLDSLAGPPLPIGGIIEIEGEAYVLKEVDVRDFPVTGY